MYLKTKDKDFRNFIEHLSVLGHDGHNAILATMHEVAEEGLDIFRDEISMRTQERSGQLLDSYVLGNKYCVYDVGAYDVVFGSALYYAHMVDRGHAIVPPGYKKHYRRQKRRKIENQIYDRYEGAHFFNPAFEKIKRRFENRVSEDLQLAVVDTSFVRKRKRKKRKPGAY